MQPVVLKSRAGFTLAEVLVALTITAIIGAAATGAFVSQSRFFDHQEKVGAARSVSRAAINVMLSELRMLEVTQGVHAASNSAITVNVPYAMGLYCKLHLGSAKVLLLPADSVVYANADTTTTGYAYRLGAGGYQYVPLTLGFTNGTVSSDCDVLSTAAKTMPQVSVISIPLGPALSAGTPMFLYQRISYHFGPSAAVPGKVGLWRTTLSPTAGTPEELLAPFDTTAKFRFYVSDNPVAQTAVPGVLNTITGIEITLDGVSERPNPDGTFQNVPLRTSVFFRNR